MAIPRPMEKDKEADFDEWLNSIEWVDEDFEIVPAVLVDDTSSDPEDDRGELPIIKKGK